MKAFFIVGVIVAGAVFAGVYYWNSGYDVQSPEEIAQREDAARYIFSTLNKNSRELAYFEEPYTAINAIDYLSDAKTTEFVELGGLALLLERVHKNDGFYLSPDDESTLNTLASLFGKVDDDIVNSQLEKDAQWKASLTWLTQRSIKQDSLGTRSSDGRWASCLEDLLHVFPDEILMQWGEIVLKDIEIKQSKAGQKQLQTIVGMFDILKDRKLSDSLLPLFLDCVDKYSNIKDKQASGEKITILFELVDKVGIENDANAYQQLAIKVSQSEPCMANLLNFALTKSGGESISIANIWKVTPTSSAPAWIDSLFQLVRTNSKNEVGQFAGSLNKLFKDGVPDEVLTKATQVIRKVVRSKSTRKSEIDKELESLVLSLGLVKLGKPDPRNNEMLLPKALNHLAHYAKSNQKRKSKSVKLGMQDCLAMLNETNSNSEQLSEAIRLCLSTAIILDQKSNPGSLSKAAWNKALGLKTRTVFKQLMADIADAKINVKLGAATIKQIQSAGELKEVVHVGVKLVEQMEPFANIYAYSGDLVDSVKHSNVALSNSISYPNNRLQLSDQLPSEITDQHLQIATAVCILAARQEPKIWSEAVKSNFELKGSLFSTTKPITIGKKPAIDLNFGAVDSDKSLEEVKRKLATDFSQFDNLSRKGKFQLAWVCADKVLEKHEPAMKTIRSFQSAFSAISSEEIAPFCIDALLIPDNQIQQSALRWLSEKLGAEKATDAFFTQFHARREYKTSQLNLYAECLKRINKNTGDKYIVAAFEKAAKNAGGHHRLSWVIKLLSIEILEDIGAEDGIKSLSKLLKDPGAFVDIEYVGSKKTETKREFKKLAASAIQKIAARTKPAGTK